jgi:integrase/recombinase XerD
MNINSLLDDYIRSEELNPKKHIRLISRKTHFNSFIEFLDGRKVEDIHYKEALEYQGYIIERGNNYKEEYSASTINGYILAISGFYDYLESRNLVFNNPFSTMKRLRLDKNIPRNILSDNNMAKLLNYFRDWNKELNLKRRVSLYKMHVISELMYSTGLRVHEAGKLMVEDIKLFTGYVTVREGKGGFSRKAILNDYAKSVLNIYITRMRELTFTKRNLPNKDLLFGMTSVYFEKYVNESLLKATLYLGLNKITSHGFRHAVGYHLLKSGCDIRHIQEVLGHRSLKNTEIYTKVDREDLRKILDKFHPRQFKRISDETNHKPIKEAI